MRNRLVLLVSDSGLYLFLLGLSFVCNLGGAFLIFMSTLNVWSFFPYLFSFLELGYSG
jgi:hypothetical protein